MSTASADGRGQWSPPAAQSSSEVVFPLGLVGDLANYFYESAIRPVRVVALAAALALMAALTGRQYNISGTGLNLYLMVTAKTGRGKSGLEDGMDRLLAAVRSEFSSVDEFLGPGAIAFQDPQCKCVPYNYSLSFPLEAGTPRLSRRRHPHQSCWRILPRRRRDQSRWVAA